MNLFVLLRDLDLVTIGVSQIGRTTPVEIVWCDLNCQALLNQFPAGFIHIFNLECNMVLSTQFALLKRVSVMDEQLHTANGKYCHLFRLSYGPFSQKSLIKIRHFFYIVGKVSKLS